MPGPIQLDIISDLRDIDAGDWDALAGEDNPFVEHDFLAALETSGSVGSPDTGWVPRHLLARRDQELLAAMPLYEKYDSYGEYIFDWGWARAAEMAGIPYYPKLVSAIPFTPATGPRLLLHPGLESPTQAIAALVDGFEELGNTIDASSGHVLFCSEQDQHSLCAERFLERSSYQFHWRNDSGWQNFDDYLGALRSSTRKQVRRERRMARSHGLTLSTRRGEELSSTEWSALWDFYQNTTSRKYAIAYLTREFFDMLAGPLSHRVLSTWAHRGSQPIAAALLFWKGRHLYGRYWGSHERLDGLHFELCYYRPIEWCLGHGITRFEAGAQGQHKLKRGFTPSLCRSAHWIRHPELARAVARFLPQEDLDVRHEMEILSAHTPFKRG